MSLINTAPICARYFVMRNLRFPDIFAQIALITKRFNNKGVAAIEFALILPVMILFFLGMMGITSYVMMERKVESAVNDIAFLYSRNKTGLYDEFNVAGSEANYYYLKTSYTMAVLGQLIMYPHPAAVISNDGGNGSYKAVPRFAGSITYFGLPLTDDFATAGALPTPRQMWKMQLSDVITPPYSGGRGNIPNTFEEYSVSGNTIQLKPDGGSFHDMVALNYAGESYLFTTIGYTATMTDSGVAMFNVPAIRNLFASSFFGRVGYIEKTAVYSVRNFHSDLNGDGVIELSERSNNMHVCTQCNISSCAGSSASPTARCVGSVFMNADTPLWRRPCVLNSKISTLSEQAFISGGCSYN